MSLETQGGRRTTTTPLTVNGPATDHDPPTAYAAGGLDQAIANADSDWWSIGARLALSQLALTGRPFDVDMLLDLVGDPQHPCYVGAAVAACQRQGVIEAVGAKVGRDGRLCRIWIGAAA